MGAASSFGCYSRGHMLRRPPRLGFVLGATANRVGAPRLEETIIARRTLALPGTT